MVEEYNIYPVIFNNLKIAWHCDTKQTLYTLMQVELKARKYTEVLTLRAHIYEYI